MDDTPLDLMTDALESAPLTPEQRKVWQTARAELMAARLRIQTLESRLKAPATPQANETPALMVLTRPDFNREAARILAFDERYKTTSSVVYFTVENMENLRARHGNATAEEVIRRMCDSLLAQIRRSDILGRLGGDEFGLLLPRCDNADAWKRGEIIASKLYADMAVYWGTTLRPSISYGAYTFNDEKDASAGLKKAAESLTRIVTR